MTIYYSAHARSTAAAQEPTGFTVLHICVANQCRSPMAERIMRRELRRRLGDRAGAWRVVSAGTRASDGQPMHKYSARALQNVGADIDGFGSRRLTERIAVESDLILAATVEERDRVISRVPATLPVAFTLREFARLVAAVPKMSPFVASDPESLARAVVAEARKMRGRVPYVDLAFDDIEDPPRTATSFEQCAADITAATNAVLTALIDAPVATPARVPG